MPSCPSCGQVSSAGARYCGTCGKALLAEVPRGLPGRNLRGAPRSPDWISLDDVLYTRDKRFGAIGALLAFLGAFAPWASTRASFLWFEGGFSVHSPHVWLFAMAAIAAAVFLFRKRSGSIVLVFGIIIGAATVILALTMLGEHTSPSWGVLLTIAGGGLLAYSGHMTNQYERPV